MKSKRTTTAQTTVKPDYRNIKKEKRTLVGSKEIVPTAKDSADYRSGFENTVNKVRNTTIPKSSNYTRGAREAIQRGLKNGGTVKAIKKAQRGKTIFKKEMPKPPSGDSLVTKGPYRSNIKYSSEQNKRDWEKAERNVYIPKNPKDAVTPLKNGGKVKDKKWIQKATASIKRRGTEGKCTPITKKGCTGKAKALAKTFKAMAKARKK